MSFSWAVTDKTTRSGPKPDTFRGYFTDIQRAARRSLPKNPDKDLRSLLGLTLVPAGNESARAKTINNQIQDTPTDVEGNKESVIESGNEEPKIKRNKQTFAEKVLSKLPCRNQEKECSEREKMISSFAVYLAIVIFILLIILIILAATISALSKKDDSSSSVLSGGPTSTLNPSTTTLELSTTGILSSTTSPSTLTGQTNTFTTLSALTSLISTKASKATTLSVTNSAITEVTTSKVTFQASVSTAQTSSSTTAPSPKTFSTKSVISSTSPTSPPRVTTSPITSSSTLTADSSSPEQTTSSSSDGGSTNTSTGITSSATSESPITTIQRSSSLHPTTTPGPSTTTRSQQSSSVIPTTTSVSPLTSTTTRSQHSSSLTPTTAPGPSTTTRSQQSSSVIPTTASVPPITSTTRSQQSSSVIPTTLSGPPITFATTIKQRSSSVIPTTTSGPPITSATTIKQRSSSVIPTTTSGPPITSATTIKQQSSSVIPTTTSGPSKPSLTPITSSGTVSSKRPSITKLTSTQSTTRPQSTLPSTSVSATMAPLPYLDKPRITCTSPECISADKTLDRVDFGTSPCSDFYEFACEGWINKTTDRLADSNQRNVPSTLRGELRFQLLKQLQVLLQAVYYETDSLTVRISRRLYQSCLESNINGNTELGDVQYRTSLEELQEVLTRLQMSADGVIQTTLDDILSEARSTFQITPFFKMSTIIMEDGNDRKVFGIQVSPPDLYLDLENYRGSFQNNAIAQLYVTRVTEVLLMYLSTFNTEGFIPGVPQAGVSYEQAFSKVQQSFRIEVDISQIIAKTTNFSSRSHAKNNIITFSELKRLYPNINWDAALGSTSTDALINLKHPAYFQSLNGVLLSFNEEDVKMFVFLSVLVQRVWTYMPYPLRNMIRDISKHTDTIYSGFDCVEKTVELAHEETHALYVSQYTQEVLKNRLNVAGLKNTVSQMFQTLLSQSDWVMADLERVVSVFLANTKLVFSPVQTYIRETEGIVSAQKSFLFLAIELHQQKQGYESFLVTSVVDEDNFIRDWTSPYLTYEDTLRIIAVPTGISVFVNNDNQPNFDFHGYVGFMLAEQLLKVMTGEMVNGVVPDWWGENNFNLFEAIEQCFIRQIPPDRAQQIDVGNIIVANGAFQIIDEVFRIGTPFRQQVIENTAISQEMLFYINTAQLECSVDTTEPHKFRVNNWASNSERFSVVFSCPKQSPMLTDQKCYFFF